MLSFRSLAASCAVLLVSIAAQAAPIAYTFTGLASGELDGVAFTNQPLRVSFHADTDNVEAFMPGGFFVVPDSSAVVLGSGPALAFIDGLYVFNVQDPNNGHIGFGTVVQGDLIDLDVGGLQNYDLSGAFGPVSGLASPAALAQFQDVPLAGATLTLTSFTDASFVAQFVPEPASWALALLGCGAAGGIARRRPLRA